MVCFSEDIEIAWSPARTSVCTNWRVIPLATAVTDESLAESRNAVFQRALKYVLKNSINVSSSFVRVQACASDGPMIQTMIEAASLSRPMLCLLPITVTAL